ncbi:LytTR family transcriptional regulator DNA-binding domain-containing protein [Paenibacillus sp. OV219]|uniref:LytTR family transcriptional regulator DNA-binding domain-containing protein n=1 Tax=Paenibacillus sp. OV219 TaxID=1884377 RepID=UPI0008D3FAC0|nr:LytTR family transcriptional regulator DNA-binding domain-containing protein [Paenibacillus sp. OV219]SEO74165.1 LytTr DNA-binding domain-containing protein [Paenibacillus sp. OV219]
MKIPVVKRFNKKEFDIIFIDLEDVLLMRSYRGEVYYQTREGLYSQISTFEEHERFLVEQGFKKVDRCYVVQMDQVEFFDDVQQRLYFVKRPVNSDSPSAPVSGAHLKSVEKLINHADSEGASTSIRNNLSGGLSTN